jgi:PAS domain S-box-containing protein
LAAAARRLGRLIGRRLTIIDSTGVVLGDSEFDDGSLRLLENHRDRPEVRRALAEGVGAAVRFSASTQRPEFKVAVRAWPGVVRLSAPPDQVDAVVSGVQRAVLLASLSALLIGAVLAVVAGRAITQPLTRLAIAARGLAAGNAPTLPASGAPEVRQLVRAFRTMQDEITGRIAQLQHGREETEVLVESMVEGVVGTDAQGQVVVSNTAARRIVGYEPDEPLPNARELFHAPDAREVVDQVLDGRAVLGREVPVGDRTVLATARPLPNAGAVICLHDITELRRLETVRRDFVANVSHELRTPLTSITGYAETLRHETPDADTLRKFLDVILTNATRMQRLIDDLLDLARFESGTWQPSLAPVDVAGLVDTVWSPFADRAAGGGVGFRSTVPADLTVPADAEALRQILSNLFDNALRHTPPGGAIEVTGRRTDGDVQLVVRDTGSGIPAEHLSRVFERFYRVDPGRSRDQGGTGLGLAIVRHLVEAHRGRVDLESAVGRGTTVRIVLPGPKSR